MYEIFWAILLVFIIFQFLLGKKQSRLTLLVLNIGFIIVYSFLSDLIFVGIYFLIFNWTETLRNLWMSYQQVIEKIILFTPQYLMSWYLWIKKRKTIKI